MCLSLFHSLFLSLVALWHLNENPLHPRTLFVPRHLLLIPPLFLLLLTSNFVMIKPVRTLWRTSHDEAFIWIFPILTFPMSSIVGVGSHCVESRSLVPPWSYKNIFCHSRSRYTHCSHYGYCIWGAIVWGLCLKMNSRLFYVRHLLLGVTIKTPLAWALQKVRDFLTWWWHSFSIHCLTITLSQSLVLNFYYPFLRDSLLIFSLTSSYPL